MSIITVDLKKVKEIAHVKRRAMREEEFAPHDAIIMKQIPGVDAVAAEEARQAIRTKYDKLQTSIDNAKTVDGVKKLIDIN
jgi:ERCC4-type nuclease